MRCYKHDERETVGQCMDCSRTLCSECIDVYRRPLCDYCALERLNADKEIVKRKMVLGIVFLGIGLISVLLFASDNLPYAFIYGLFIAAIPWGWYALNIITQDFFLFMSCAAWITYFFVKILLSMFVGIVVAPFQIFKLIRGKNEIDGNLIIVESRQEIN